MTANFIHVRVRLDQSASMNERVLVNKCVITDNLSVNITLGVNFKLIKTSLV